MAPLGQLTHRGWHYRFRIDRRCGGGDAPKAEEGQNQLYKSTCSDKEPRRAIGNHTVTQNYKKPHEATHIQGDTQSNTDKEAGWLACGKLNGSE